ncbi:unnamed protein product [Amoebophrya sp. A120]|nr:unnamed protein product [Amoebophrya sp. A120]|eukprot:GSA120T00012135001.1
MSSSASTLKPPIVIDTGTGGVKAGIAGDKFPALYFPTCVARAKTRLDQNHNGGPQGPGATSQLPRVGTTTSGGSSSSSSSPDYVMYESKTALFAKLQACPWINQEFLEELKKSHSADDEDDNLMPLEDHEDAPGRPGGPRNNDAVFGGAGPERPSAPMPMNVDGSSGTSHNYYTEQSDPRVAPGQKIRNTSNNPASVSHLMNRLSLKTPDSELNDPQNMLVHVGSGGGTMTSSGAAGGREDGGRDDEQEDLRSREDHMDVEHQNEQEENNAGPQLQAAADEETSKIIIGPRLWSSRWHSLNTHDLSYPMKEGQVDNWDDLEKLWDYCFHELGIDPSEHTIVLTEPVLNNHKKRETMVEMMFERYGFKAVNISVQGVLSLYSEGMRTGVVVDSGDGCTHIVPVYDGFVQPALVQRMNIGGRHVTQQLQQLLTRNNLDVFGAFSSPVLQELKENSCYMAYDLEKEMQLHQNTTAIEQVVALYDHRTSNALTRVRVGEERFLAPEILMNPRMYQEMNFDYGHQNAGVAEFLYQTVMDADVDLRRTYFSAILLSGGNTLFPGFKSRLDRELRQLYKDRVGGRMVFKVEDPARRKFAVFLGASFLAETAYCGNDYSRFLNQAEYEEGGAAGIHSYCMPQS